MADTDVLIAGAGPIGLTAAIELRRHGVRCRIVDPLLQPPQYAKAVGVQPRTLEIFEGMGVLRQVLDAAIQMRGQIVYVNGERVSQLELTLPDDIPFGFTAIPQYDTERILRDLDVVKREEFDAVKDMARLAREENEALKVRIAALEAKLGGSAG